LELDYTKGCVNFRDVGVSVHLIASKPLLPKGRLYRGGKLDFVRSASEIRDPATIINLRTGTDKNLFGADYYHFPISKDYKKYETSCPEVRLWLNRVIGVFETERTRYPVLIHCALGKDRTGVVVASLLRILGIPDPVIVEEYLLSVGEVKQELILLALDGIGDVKSYFKGIDLNRVRRNILGTT
jgi:protein-tyrosine phosphatase